MQYIKQKSTNKAVYREEPHTDKTLSNASNFLSTDASDLEVVEENLNAEQYSVKFLKEQPYKVARKNSYPFLQDQLDAIWKGGSDAEEMKTRINKVKTDYPK
tara:strand:+ start:371 stop:676 length:306 start_codon:yes stop_codon:yes gene_type:complete